MTKNEDLRTQVLGPGAIQLSCTAAGSEDQTTVPQYLIRRSIDIHCGPAIPLLGKCLPGMYIQTHRPRHTYNNIQRRQNSVTNKLWRIHTIEYYTAGVSQRFLKRARQQVFLALQAIRSLCPVATAGLCLWSGKTAPDTRK